MATRKKDDEQHAAEQAQQKAEGQRLEAELHAGSDEAAEELPIKKGMVRLRFVAPINPNDGTEAIILSVDHGTHIQTTTVQKGGMVDVPAKEVDALMARLAQYEFARED